MGTFTANLGLIQPTPGDPAVANLWGGLLNTNAGLLDNAIAGLLSKSVAGSANVVLTVSNGSTDETRYKGFIFTGVLTGNINVLWPGGVTGFFMVKNSTTGAFTLSLGVNNGSGSPVGSTSAIAHGATGIFYSDGTNVSAQLTASAISGLGAAALKGVTGNQANVPTVIGSQTDGDLVRYDNAGNLADTGINAGNVLTKSGNLSGVGDEATSRANLGLGNISTANYNITTGAPSGSANNGDLWIQY